MPVRDALKVSRKTFFDPKAWIGWEQMKYQFATIVGIVGGLFTVPTPTREETFEQALTRFNISPEEVAALSARYLHFAAFFVLCFFLSFAYAFFLLFAHHAFFAFLMAFAIGFFFLSQAFRFHFWHYQLKIKRFGVTFAEWKNALLGRKE